MNDIADRLAVIDVLIREATAMDSRDWESLRSVFAADAIKPRPGAEPLRGPVAIVESIAKGFSRYVSTQHLIGNSIVSIDGSAATARTYVLASHILPGPPPTLRLTAGTYHDRLSRTDGKWQIVERRLDITWDDTRPFIETPPR